jgi:hypothetical protein
MPMTVGGGSVPTNPYSEIARRFQGLGDTISMEYFTVSLWHRWITAPDADSPRSLILNMRGRGGTAGTQNVRDILLVGGSSGWGLRLNSVGLYTWNGEYTIGTNTGTDDIVEGQWYHYAIVGDGSNGVKVYQDGVEVLSQSTSLIGIGYVDFIRSPGNNYEAITSEGQVAHAKYWTVPLTQSEIASEMATGEPFRLSDIKCWRPHLDDTSDYLGILGNSQPYPGTFGGSVPVAWLRQNALYDPSMGGGDEPPGPDPVTVALPMVQVNMYN